MTVVYAFNLCFGETDKPWHDFISVSRFWYCREHVFWMVNRNTILGKRVTIFGLLDKFSG